MSYTVRPAAGHNPWLVKRWPTRGQHICGVTIHATRSGSAGADYDDGPGTERWGMNPNNKGAGYWGTYWDRLIWRDGTRLICTDVPTEYASWTAGYGDAGTWALGMYYVQIEVAQARPDQRYSHEQIDSLAQEVAQLAATYNFPIRRIPYVSQRGPKPRGITTHEDSANGRKLGKSDPGALFPWDAFLSRTKFYLEGGGIMAEELDRLLVALLTTTTEKTRLAEDGKRWIEMVEKAKARVSMIIAQADGYDGLFTLWEHSGLPRHGGAAPANHRHVTGPPTDSDPLFHAHETE